MSVARVIAKQMAGVLGDGAKEAAPKVAKALDKFTKTRKAYKLFVKGKDGELYPLFVNARQKVPQGEWLEADFPDTAFKGKRKANSEETYYVPTKGAERSAGEKSKNTGDPVIIPDEETRQKLIDAGFITDKTKRTEEAPYGKVTAVAARPGWHSSTNPVAEHLGPQDLIVTKDEVPKLIEAGINRKAIKKRTNKKTGETTYYVKRRAEDQVWAEVDMADDTSEEWATLMKEQGRTDINDRVPKGGSYSYQDGQADGDTWVVGGDMRINRTLSREEARAIQEEMGVKDLPYRDEVEAILGRKFAEGGMVEDMGSPEIMLGTNEGEPTGLDPILRHHYTNIVNGSTVAAEGDSVQTVYTKTFQLEDGRAVLIPTVFDGQVIEDDAAALDRAYEDGAFMIFNTEEEAQAYDEMIHQDMSPDTTKEEAMQFLVEDAQGTAKQFAKGGSVEKDPISGNEVPKGALPNEVRDDVPAMLSEGEFVIPADVVRYIGLDKLRKMRDQAKKGLEDMDSEGQIGGEEAVVEMAQGGYLGAKTPDYMKQSERLFTAPKMQNLPKEGQAMYGGQFPTTTPAGPVTPTPVVPTVGQAPTYEMRKYRHPDGRVLYVPVIGGVEQIAVPEGFVIADRAQDIGDEAEKIKDGEDATGDTPATGVAPLPTPDTGSGDSGDGMPDPGSSLVGEAARIEQMGETLNDPELTKLANELKWEQTWDGIKDAAKMLIVPGGMIAAFKEGTEDKPTVQRDENGSVNVDEKGHPIYVDKDGKVVTVETTDKQNALHEYIYNQYGEDIARTLLGASDSKVTRNEMSEMMTQMAESFGLAVKDGTLTPEQARQYQMTAMAGLLNSPAAKEGKLGEELAKSSVQKELNWFDRLFMSEADEKAAEAKRTEQLSSNAKDIKAAMDLKAAQEELARKQEEERKAEEERIRAADEAEKQRIADAQAKALKEQQAAAAQMGSKAWTGGEQKQTYPGATGSYTPNYDISSWYSDSGSVSGGTGYTAGSSGTSGWSSANTSSTGSRNDASVNSGYAGAKGGLVTKKHVKKSKKKGLIAKK